ncbi:hypothetical protein K501DRAFT_286818 [Backusella circina FSU 941]|nr:hypothetical protein K501DRAFT_286818 [Backusella circina FSU 941]
MATKQDKVLSPNHQYQKYQFVCPNCDASFPSQVDIHHHSRHTCIANEEEFYCNLCDSGFPFMRFLRDHYDSIHAQVIKVRDPEDSTFGSEIQVERNDAGYFCCPTCDSRYKLATSFKNHLRRPCTETRGLKMCEICSRYFDGENGIIIHKYNYHHREINVKGIYLKDHEREVAFTRDDEEEFQCPSCLFKSNNSSVFKGHVLKKPCRGDIVKKASHGRKFNISTRGKSQEGHDPTHKGK